jgi:hypothetical protein
MSSLQLNLINNDTRYTYRQLVQLRRQMLRFVRSIPPGSERNARRQTARSLRNLVNNKEWLNDHTVEGACSREPLEHCPR